METNEGGMCVCVCVFNGVSFLVCLSTPLGLTQHIHKCAFHTHTHTLCVCV